MKNANSIPSFDRKLLALAAILTIAALFTAVSCTIDNGKPAIDYEKAQSAILAATNVAIESKLSGNKPGEIKAKAIAAGLAALKTEPAPLEIETVESK